MSDIKKPKLLHGQTIKRRGALTNPANRFHKLVGEEEFTDEQHAADSEEVWQQTLQTTVQVDNSKKIINYNDSPDIGFERSINPYRGCEHGCIYCFARPTHAYWDLSPGLDFETKLFYKPNAVELLREEISKRYYTAQPIVLGINTDAYQPIEKRYKITRQLLEVMLEVRHPVSLLTKSATIERDMDIIKELYALDLVSIAFSIPTLNGQLARILEPRAAPPMRRLMSIERFKQEGIDTGVMMAPIIPYINDSEIENLLSTIKEKGATRVAYTLLRMPYKIKQLFSDWLYEHYPDRAKKVLNIIRDMHGGKLYNSEFGKRMSGQGQYPLLIKQRFRKAVKDNGLNASGGRTLRTDLFSASYLGGQMGLF